MGWVQSEASVRRGLIVALDGLAVWLLAVALAAYTDAGAVAQSGRGLLPTAVETMLGWATTPGVGAFELLAYAGLAVAVVGPTWYWYVRPRARRQSLEGPLSVFDRRGDGFQYEQPGSPAHGSWGRLVRDRAPLAISEAGPATRGDGAGLERVAELFEPEPGEREILRGSAGRSAGGPERPAATVDRTGDRVDHPAPAPTDEIVVAMDEPDQAVDAGTTTDTDGTAGGTDAAGAVAGAEGSADTTDEGAAVESEEPASEAPVDAGLDRLADASVPAGAATDEPAATDGQASAGRTGDPPTSLDELGSALAASQARLDAVSDRLAAATNGQGVEAVAADLASIGETADGRLQPLSAITTHRPLPIGRRLPEIRADGRRIESGFRAALDGD